MKAKSLWIALAGTLAGLAFAVGGIVLSAGLLVDGGAQVVVTDFSTGTTRPVIQVDQVHLYLYVVIGGFLAGAIIAAVTAMLASHANPDEPRFSIVPVTLIGSVLGAAIAYAVFRATLGIGGTSVEAPTGERSTPGLPQSASGSKSRNSSGLRARSVGRIASCASCAFLAGER